MKIMQNYYQLYLFNYIQIQEKNECIEKLGKLEEEHNLLKTQFEEKSKKLTLLIVFNL